MVPDILSPIECDEYTSILPSISDSGSRLLLQEPVFQELAISLRSHSALARLIENLTAVQGIFFRKTLDHNWSLSLHGDRVFPIDGHGAWPAAAPKEGLPYVVVPEDVVTRFVAVRIALDDSPDGDLRLLPGSHRDTPSGLTKPKTIHVPKGGVLVLNPTLQHGSAKLKSALARRVLHFVFAPTDLPAGYAWCHSY